MDLSPSLRHLIISVCCYACLLNNLVLADDRQVIDYSYDVSGNLIEKITNITFDSLPPVISSFNPSIVRHNATTLITLDGQYLKNLQVSSDDSGLSVSDVESTNSQVTFKLNVSAEVALGAHTLIFSTLSGQISQTIEVFPKLPEMVIRPSPLALVVGRATEVIYGISSVDVIDHHITISIADPAIISAALSSLTIAAGERFPVEFPEITGLNIGITTLTFSSQALGEKRFTVVVDNMYQPPPGTQINVRSDLLGLVLPSNSPSLNELGPLISSLSVFLTPVLEPDVSIEQLQLSPLLNIVYGSVFTEIRPKAIAAGSTATLTIKGYGLSAVTGLTIFPVDGITPGGWQVNPEGTEITASLSVAPGVTFSSRSVQLLTADSEIKPVIPDIRRLYVGGKTPAIESIEPVVASRFTTQALNVTGFYFDGDVQLKIIPPDDVIVSKTATINADHTGLSVDLNIGEYAELGQRVITVENLNGSSASTGLPSNTLTIVNGISGEVPVTSLPLGVVIDSNAAQEVVSQYSPELGVVRGPVVTDIQPLKSTTDTSVRLTIEGYGLDNVTTINFEPDQGITVGPPQIAGDGLLLTVDVTIAADAQTTIRLLSVVAGATKLAFTRPEASRFLVLGSVPQVDYISPNFIVAGDIATISVHGQSFETVDSVRIEPNQGVTVSVPQINADHSLITVQVTADVGAQLGNRTLIVNSNAGESSSVPSAENQINIVSQELLTVNSSLVSSLLGVFVDNGSDGTISHEYTVASDLYGVDIPELPVVITETQYSFQLLVVKGSFLHSISPVVLEVGVTTPLTISGDGLQDVTAVEFLPVDGLSLQSSLLINPEATEVKVDIVVATDAEKTVRRVALFQNGNTDNALPYVKAESSMIVIAGGLPIIESISPVLQVANSQFELLVRGQGLQEVTAVHAYDSNGVLENLISFDTPVVNIDATELRVTVVVDRLVTAGEKAIVLTAPVGGTSTTVTSVNTITIDTLTD